MREIRRIKARIERERIPATEDPQFHLKLGRGSLSDVEFTAQLLQLEHGVRSASTIGALEALAARGFLDADDHAVLQEAYRFCEAHPQPLVPRELGPWRLAARIAGAPGGAGAVAWPNRG